MGKWQKQFTLTVSSCVVVVFIRSKGTLHLYLEWMACNSNIRICEGVIIEYVQFLKNN